MSKKILKTCLSCDKPFEANYYDSLKGMGLYCSKNCHHNYRRKIAVESGARLILPCKQCGKVFTVNKGELTKGNGKYCSVFCSIEAHKGTGSTLFKGKVVLSCQECKKNFEVFPAHVERTKFCSQRCSGINKYRKSNQMNKGVQRGKGGKRADLDDRYFRSSWEANYARYLNFLIKTKEILKWEYEVDTFEFGTIKRGVRFYTPDFKVFNKDGSVNYHEVKGWMDAKSKTRAKRMAKYYPEVQVRLIGKDWFRANGKSLSKIITNWESKVY
jgi:hypothetical protein